ncbi:hypothetical protein BN863_29760 [Formosa agariphila KMM 3901]|uniref:Uncharacterized protein n=1 Tax=Formosa agariphila (strain DSM 15362 / KCTC 12365 / LMG 23005 / KMM 3901 / M-2Alg 35-1) TaxID=1347342 RepID=T2KQB2_FORAG|nr:hypothetical protein BN863_29760 [Formosa agariphila KMM 3901]
MNKAYKLFKYVYLIFAAIFIYQAVNIYMLTGKVDYSRVILIVAALFVFFFRNRFNKKFDNKH